MSSSSHRKRGCAAKRDIGDIKMKTKVVHKRIFFVIIIGGLLIINFGYTLYLQVTDKPVIISSLSIGWSQSKQQSEDITIPMGITDLRVCGFLESSREIKQTCSVFTMRIYFVRLINDIEAVDLIKFRLLYLHKVEERFHKIFSGRRDAHMIFSSGLTNDAIHQKNVGFGR